MSSLPPALNFSETEEEIVKKWKEENSFHRQNELSLERGDEVGFSPLGLVSLFIKTLCANFILFLNYVNSINHYVVSRSILHIISSSFSYRSTHFTMVLHSQLDCLTMDTFWQEPSRTPSLVTLP